MEETLTDHREVLLVKEKSSDEIKAVKEITTDGKVKTTAAKQANEPDFMKIDKNANALENFLSNFLRQAENPTHFRFFKVPLEKLEDRVNKISNALKNTQAPENKELLDKHRIKTTAIDEKKVDWKQFERLSVSREDLEKSGNMERLLNWQKTNLVPVSLRFDDTLIRTDARLALKEMPDGKLSISIHALRKKPDLESPFLGIRFNEEDKQNLLRTGNLGRTAEVEFSPQEKAKMFISLDGTTNELVAVRADKLRLNELNEVKGVVLTQGQKQELADGKAVWVENMIDRKGENFSAFIQVNADKRSIEFKFDHLGQHQGQSGEIRIPAKLLGVELSEAQKESLKSGKTIYVEGMTDKSGREFNSYVQVNTEKNKLDFLKYKPSETAKSTKTTIKQTPDTALGQTQKAEKKEVKPQKAIRQKI